MAISTFNPPVGPSPGTGFEPRFAVNEVEFGDGYSSVTPNGINATKLTLNLKWAVLTPEWKDAIYDFLMARAGVEPFYYTPAGADAPIKFRCTRVRAALPESGWTVDATFVQDFSNAT